MKHSTNLRAEEEAIFSDNVCVGVAYGWDDGEGCRSKEVALANARLWVASPDLFGSLLNAQRFLEDMHAMPADFIIEESTRLRLEFSTLLNRLMGEDNEGLQGLQVLPTVQRIAR